MVSLYLSKTIFLSLVDVNSPLQMIVVKVLQYSIAYFQDPLYLKMEKSHHPAGYQCARVKSLEIGKGPENFTFLFRNQLVGTCNV